MKLEQTTHAQYSRGARPWFGFNWRYDSGMVGEWRADVAAALKLTGNEQVTIGFACNGVQRPCKPDYRLQRRRHIDLITLPQTGTENDDHNPDRVKHVIYSTAPWATMTCFTRPLKWSLRLTVVNLTTRWPCTLLLDVQRHPLRNTRTETAELVFPFLDARDYPGPRLLSTRQVRASTR